VTVVLASLYYQSNETSPTPEKKTPPSKSTRKPNDCKLSREKTILIVLSPIEELQEVINNFHGIVVTDLTSIPPLSDKIVYLCGDIGKATGLIDRDKATRAFILRELSENFEDICLPSWKVVSVGKMPVDINGVGVYYRRFFDQETDFFNKIRSQHVFQSLTESNKPGTAHRTGIYLSSVEKQGEDVRFHLLRCSTNLSGPTGRFQEHDTRVVNALNLEADVIFENQAPLNHVLAQIYRNTPGNGHGKKASKASKAKIKDHADKTKDMPENGLMAFVTFYDQIDLNELQALDSNGFDYGIFGKKGDAQSALTKLIFRLKPSVLERDPDCPFARNFSITLYPNSVFFMPLSTNRLYTHEIKPSHLDVSLIPTRMGYVVRCSDTEAIHRDGHN